MGVLIFNDPSWGDWYYQEVYIPLNRNLQSILNFSEAPFYMVLIVVLLIIMVGQILSGKGDSWQKKTVSWALFISSGIIFLSALFYWMWGFNYGRTSISASYFGNEYITLDTLAFKKRWELQTNRVNFLRKKFVMPDSSQSRLTVNYASRFRKTASVLKDHFDLDTSLKPQCKEFVPAGLLLRLNTAGFYFPFGSESYVDKALHVSQKPFVIAHELAHGYGVTDEGEANFVGYVLSQESADPLARYSSALALWLYMAADGHNLDNSFIKKMWDGLSPAVWSDLDARRKLDDRFPELMPRMRDAIYDSYLTMNKVKGGIKSYNRFVKMVLTYESGKK